jgi:hypothetical protein
MKFFAEETACWDCGDELKASPKQYFMGIGDETGLHISCPRHNRGYGAQVAPTGNATNPIEIEIDLAGSRRKTEEALRDTMRLLSEADAIRLLATINVAIESARHASLKWTDAGFIRR